MLSYPKRLVVDGICQTLRYEQGSWAGENQSRAEQLAFFVESGTYCNILLLKAGFQDMPLRSLKFSTIAIR